MASRLADNGTAQTDKGTDVTALKSSTTPRTSGNISGFGANVETGRTTRYNSDGSEETTYARPEQALAAENPAQRMYEQYGQLVQQGRAARKQRQDANSASLASALLLTDQNGGFLPTDVLPAMSQQHGQNFAGANYDQNGNYIVYGYQDITDERGRKITSGRIVPIAIVPPEQQLAVLQRSGLGYEKQVKLYNDIARRSRLTPDQLAERGIIDPAAQQAAQRPAAGGKGMTFGDFIKNVFSNDSMMRAITGMDENGEIKQDSSSPKDAPMDSGALMMRRLRRAYDEITRPYDPQSTEMESQWAKAIAEEDNRPIAYSSIAGAAPGSRLPPGYVAALEAEKRKREATAASERGESGEAESAQEEPKEEPKGKEEIRAKIAESPLEDLYGKESLATFKRNHPEVTDDEIRSGKHDRALEKIATVRGGGTKAKAIKQIREAEAAERRRREAAELARKNKEYREHLDAADKKVVDTAERFRRFWDEATDYAAEHQGENGLIFKDDYETTRRKKFADLVKAEAKKLGVSVDPNPYASKPSLFGEYTASSVFDELFGKGAGSYLSTLKPDPGNTFRFHNRPSGEGQAKSKSEE